MSTSDKESSGGYSPLTMPTMGDLLAMLYDLSPQQLARPIRVTSGCDENGNAVLVQVQNFAVASDRTMDSVLEDGDIALVVPAQVKPIVRIMLEGGLVDEIKSDVTSDDIDIEVIDHDGWECGSWSEGVFRHDPKCKEHVEDEVRIYRADTLAAQALPHKIG